MHLPGWPSLLFAVATIVVIPVMALRSAGRVRQLRAQGAMPSRVSMLAQSLLSLTLLFGIAFSVGRSFGFDVFATPPVGAREVALAVAALGALFAIRALLRWTRDADEERRLAVFSWMPRTTLERALFVAVAIVAGVSEETVYRGVGMQILWHATGAPKIAAIVMALAFAAAHAAQGRKSAVAVFAIALVMHALVWHTGTLVLAMAVHAVYDVAAGILAGNRARRLGLP
ncbi:MAG: CPBP family intramembrane metalloprotease [Gemmatimonadetes bacterium]|nr:CPBP family intramembrane metalloprotease [Gemmatimonadota bacterium]MBI3568736.1 CPBP family intramembrane metalloprotease [Gemmatimonadota bacterium]